MQPEPAKRPLPPLLALLRTVARAVRRIRLVVTTGSVVDKSAVVGPGIYVSPGARLLVGHRVTIGRGVFVECDVTISPNCLISSRVAFVGNDHPIDDPRPVTEVPRRPTPVILLDGDNLIGHGAVLIGPLRVGRGAVIGAGAVVTKDVSAETVVVGQPARPVRVRRRTALDVSA